MSSQAVEPRDSVAFSAGRDVRAAIARLGRTEDVTVSPDGRGLALPGLNVNRLLVLDMEVDPGRDRPSIALTGFLELESPAFFAPHGVVWAGTGDLIVANRQGGIAVVALPSAAAASSVEVEPKRVIGLDGADLATTPGSLAIRHAGLGLIELLVCNNYVDYVTRHLLDQRDGYAVLASEILLDEGLTVPDGVAQSPSGEWIAVSNHDHQNVFLFRNDERLGRTSEPQGVLSGLCYPHGLRFSGDGRTLLVADAGAPLVRIYRSEDGDWSGPRAPSEAIRVLDDAAFRRGSHTPREGGPKGIELIWNDRLMVASCERQPLAFFDMSWLLAPARSPADRAEPGSEPDRARATLVGYLAAARAAAQHETEAIRRAAAFERQALIARQEEMRALVTSRSWRLTAPLRSVNAAVQRLKRHR